MVVLLFWNTNGCTDGHIIGQLCREHKVDVLLLAETEIGSAELTTEINQITSVGRTFWELSHWDSRSRVRALTHYTPDLVLPVFDDPHVKMLAIRLHAGRPLLIVAAHLPSKMWPEPEDQSYRVRQLRVDIEREESHVGHRNTVVIGDLNLNPFEDALTAADGLHGVMDRKVALREPRVVQGRRWSYFYNPMWSRMGDDSAGPPGTYWYSGSRLVNHFWNTFDQVLLRPELLPCYDPAGLIVPTRVADRDILPQPGGGPGLSDHLPVVLGLSIDEETGRA